MVKRLPTMRETQVRSLVWEDPLEKEMATHSSTVALKIPWTEERGRLHSMGSQRVPQDWATSLSFFLSLVNHILSELSTMTRSSWVALHGMAYSFIQLDKAVVHVIRLVSFLWLWFSVCLPSDGEDKRLKYRTVKDEFLRSIYVSNMICNWRSVEK